MLTDQPALFAAAWLDAEAAADRRRECDRIAAEVARAVARAKRAPRDFAGEWAAFVEARPDVAQWIAYEAVQQLLAGKTRVVVNVLTEQARAHFKVPIDNSIRAAISDWLVAGDQRLDRVIERRRRKATR